MFKLNIEGSKVNQLRLFHSKKFRGFKFIKIRNAFSDNEDLSGEKQVITEYLVEKNEIDYTHYQIFLGLSLMLLFSILVFTLKGVSLPMLSIGFGITGIVFFALSQMKKQSFILGDIGIEMSESFFNQKIKEKFNL